ncbi:lys-63-specific deubiquitinase BRCC36-like isoform X3 [Benincasa hispida]|nr:lys-63-specific deubiquitinase BRCC36-like isoform X3 [Benincasa hispida]
MTAMTGRTTRVIGWYHSHPHITVLPSHVDVRTQGTYQLLDSGFIGLIFSCFSEDANKVGRIQVIAFQSFDGKQNHLSRPISLSPVYRNSVIDVESSLSSSENLSANVGYGPGENPEQDTGNSVVAGALKDSGTGRSSELGYFFANADTNYQGKEKISGSYLTNNTNSGITDIDPMDLSESMQEAMHRSNIEMSAAEFSRKEIPLHVMPTASLIKLDSPLMSFTDLQHVLFEEERSAYNQAISNNMKDGKVHPLTFIHHTSTYQASMCKLIEYCLSPAISALQDRVKENEIRLALLAEEARSLEIEAAKANESGPGSPHQVTHGSRASASPTLRDLYPSTASVGARSAGSSMNRSRKGL